MRQGKLRVKIPLVLTTMALLMVLTGCVGGDGYGYYDEGSEWDGTVFIGGDGYYRDRRENAFRGDRGRHAIGAASERGRSSMGGHGSEGGHAGGNGGGHR